MEIDWNNIMDTEDSEFDLEGSDIEETSSSNDEDDVTFTEI